MINCNENENDHEKTDHKIKSQIAQGVSEKYTKYSMSR